MYDHLIGDLYDSEEHQYNYMTVRGNYTWAHEEPHTCPLSHRCEEPSKPRAFPSSYIFAIILHVVFYEDL